MSLFRFVNPRRCNFGLVNTLRALWLIAIAWYELGTFYHHVSTCPWPDDFIAKGLGSASHSTHVLLVADPQVLDHRSYPDRPPWLMSLSQFIVDLNMRKSWWATKQLNPDVVVFLGDMMDGGRFAMSDEEYETYYQRFKSIFALDEDVPVYYISGNHDVGLGASTGFSDKADERYISHFGPLNQRIVIANHTFVLIDAPGLIEEDHQRSNEGLSYASWAASKPGGVIDFIQQSSAAVEKSRMPTVLLTHIPLARPNTASCGPLREKGTIRAGAGYGYVNTLSVQASQFLLQSTRPSIIFSGDDHDYCEYDHPLPASGDIPMSEHRSVKEVTVKSFSMAMGVRKPGFQLLSLIPAPLMPFGVTTEKTLDDAPCILPDQLDIYLSVYVPLVVFSVVILLVSNTYRIVTSGPRLFSQRTAARNIGDQDGATSSARKLSELPLPMRRFDEDDEDDEDAYILPPPTPAVSVTGKDRRLRRTTVTMCGRTLDVSFIHHLLSYLYGFVSNADATSKWRRRGLLGGFLHDMMVVGWMPIVLFVVIAWCMF